MVAQGRGVDGEPAVGEGLRGGTPPCGSTPTPSAMNKDDVTVGHSRESTRIGRFGNRSILILRR